MPKAKAPLKAASRKVIGRAGQERYLAVALETGGPRLFVDALNNVVRAEGAGRMAAKAGISRRELTEALSTDGRRDVAELLGLIEAIGGKLKLEAL